MGGCLTNSCNPLLPPRSRPDSDGQPERARSTSGQRNPSLREPGAGERWTATNPVEPLRLAEREEPLRWDTNICSIILHFWEESRTTSPSGGLSSARRWVPSPPAPLPANATGRGESHRRTVKGRLCGPAGRTRRRDTSRPTTALGCQGGRAGGLAGCPRREVWLLSGGNPQSEAAAWLERWGEQDEADTAV